MTVSDLFTLKIVIKCRKNDFLGDRKRFSDLKLYNIHIKSRHGIQILEHILIQWLLKYILKEIYLIFTCRIYGNSKSILQLVDKESIGIIYQEFWILSLRVYDTIDT